MAQLGPLSPVFSGRSSFHFFLVEKLNFLFWGWLRAFIGFSFYKVVAAAVLSVLGASVHALLYGPHSA